MMFKNLIWKISKRGDATFEHSVPPILLTVVGKTFPYRQFQFPKLQPVSVASHHTPLPLGSLLTRDQLFVH